MKRVNLQIRNGLPIPIGDEDKQSLKSFKENQIVRADLYGIKKPRSVLQNNWLHNMFRIVAENTEDEDWNTREKVKKNVKKRMMFIKDGVFVDGKNVYFEFRSFAFDEMEQDEANIKYEEAKLICAKFLGVDPEKLEANAKERMG